VVGSQFPACVVYITKWQQSTPLFYLDKFENFPIHLFLARQAGEWPMKTDMLRVSNLNWKNPNDTCKYSFGSLGITVVHLNKSVSVQGMSQFSSV
jgi:hypothetical protein